VRSLRAAAIEARDGAVVLVDAGEYRGEGACAVWTQKNLVIRANGGRVVLAADGASAEDKGTFVFRGGDASIEGIDFIGARSRDRNGAGIRLDTGARLAVARCRFEDNENGILTANDAASELTVVDSEFVLNGAGDGLSHNLYVGAIGRLKVLGCYLGRARVGHLLKSRARESTIMYSRLTGEDGTSSYELEFPSGGRAVVVGCLIQQGPKSDNSTIVSYGAEGSRWPHDELQMSFCTLINDRTRGGTFFRVPQGSIRAELLDNLLVGGGEIEVRAAGASIRNIRATTDDFADPGRFDYRLRRTSRLVGSAGAFGDLDAARPRPEREYVHPAKTVKLERYTSITPLSPGAFQRLAA
jgi:hypothetical protein